MGKWHGKIGFAKTVNTEPGVWEDQVIEKSYYGDILSSRWRRENSGGINDNINIANVISVLADSFAYENLSYMTYIEFMGTKWKISDAEVKYPRLNITMGGVYNEEQS